MRSGLIPSAGCDIGVVGLAGAPGTFPGPAFLNETFVGEGGVASATPAGCVTGGGTLLPLPGLYSVDSAGGFLSAATIRSVVEVMDMLDDPEIGSAFAPEIEPARTERVSIRVSGFMAAEGIT